MPSGHTLDRADLVPKICERMAEGVPLTTICRDLGIHRRTVNKWREEDSSIDERIQEARDQGYDALAQQCIDIADNTEEGVVIVEKGGGKQEIQRGDMLGHRKLKIETRLKLLAKWDPKRYGEKLVTENTNHTTLEIVDTDEMDRRLDRAIAAACAATSAIEPNAG